MTKPMDPQRLTLRPGEDAAHRFLATRETVPIDPLSAANRPGDPADGRFGTNWGRLS